MANGAKIGDIRYLDRDGYLWTNRIGAEGYPPVTEVRLVEVEDTPPVVLDVEGMESLGIGAKVAQPTALNDMFTFTRTEVGWKGSWGGYYTSSDFGFFYNGWLVLDEGAPIEPKPVTEPTEYGAQVEFDHPEKGRVVAYRLFRDASPWNVMFNGFNRWDGFQWSYISKHNPRIIPEEEYR